MFSWTHENTRVTQSLAIKIKKQLYMYIYIYNTPSYYLWCRSLVLKENNGKEMFGFRKKNLKKDFWIGERWRNRGVESKEKQLVEKAFSGKIMY